MAALSDVNEIKVLGLMLLLRLGQLAPNSIIPRLDEVSEAVQSIMKDVEVKDDTIKQDLERKGESLPTAQVRLKADGIYRGNAEINIEDGGASLQNVDGAASTQVPRVRWATAQSEPMARVQRVPGLEKSVSTAIEEGGFQDF